MAVAGIVLCGGRSTRMGGASKPLLDISGRPMIARVLARLAPQVDAVAISANDDADRYVVLGLPVLRDTIAGHPGPLAGVLAGLQWASTIPGVTHLLSVPGDAPFIPSDLCARLRSAPCTPVVAASSAGTIHPVVALWHLDLLPMLEIWLADPGNRRAGAFLAESAAIAVDFPLLETGRGVLDPFLNVNTPQDLARAAHLAEWAET